MKSGAAQSPIPDRQDLVLPYSEEPRQQVYKAALQRMVSTAQAEPFDALEVAGHYIKGI